MRHSGSGAACGVGFEKSILCFDVQSWIYSWWPTSLSAQVHMSHRIFATVIVLYLFFILFNLISYFVDIISKGESKKMFFPYLAHGIVPVFLVMAQTALGILSVGTHIGIVATTAHLGFAALLLGSIWKLKLNISMLQNQLYPQGITTFFSDVVGMMKLKLTTMVAFSFLIGMMLAPQSLNFFIVVKSVLSLMLIACGVSVLNCYLEKDTDRLMERTRNRAVAAGRISPKTSLSIGLVLTGLGIFSFIFLVNIVTGCLAALAGILYLFVYTPLKQKTTLSLFVGAVPGALPTVLGYTSMTGSVNVMAMGLFLLLFVWQLPHFLSISLYCVEDFQAANIKIIPLTEGPHGTKVRIFLYSILLTIVSCIPNFLNWGGIVYQWSAPILGGFLIIIAGIGFFIRNEKKIIQKWAKLYFSSTIAYLLFLLIILVSFK